MPLRNALAAESIPHLSDFAPQDISGIAWAFASSGIEHQPLWAAIAAAAITRISDFDAQSLTNTAWAFDVMHEHHHRDCYLSVAAQHFCNIATPTPNTAGMSWVELHSLDVGEAAFTDTSFLEGFAHEVAQPALQLLKAVAHGLPNDSAVDTLTSYVGKHMLPHLGLPCTRSSLALLGVNLGTGLLPDDLRAECWSVGTS